MGYLPSRWDSGDEATGPQMDEITTVDTYRRLGSRVRGNMGASGPPERDPKHRYRQQRPS